MHTGTGVAWSPQRARLFSKQDVIDINFILNILYFILRKRDLLAIPRCERLLFVSAAPVLQDSFATTAQFSVKSNFNLENFIGIRAEGGRGEAEKFDKRGSEWGRM